MESNLEIEKVQANFRTKTLVIGTVLGAAVGLAGAYMFINTLEKKDGEFKISAGEGLRVGLLLFGLLRQIADLPNQ